MSNNTKSMILLTDMQVKEFNESVLRDEYYDIITTEECFVDQEYEIHDNIILGYN